jgi:hypothetical protein
MDFFQLAETVHRRAVDACVLRSGLMLLSASGVMK